MRTRISVLLAALALTVAGCGGDDEAEPASDSTARPAAEDSDDTAEALPFEGTWQTAPMTERHVVDTLTAADLEHMTDWLLHEFAVDDGWHVGTDDQEGHAFTLRVQAGQLTLFRSLGDGELERIDGGTYEGDSDLIEYTSEGECCVIFHWSVDEDQLSLVLDSLDGVPPDVADVAYAIVRAFYTSLPFDRTEL